MEYPEPWHSRPEETWPRLQAAIKRLNRVRKRKGLPILYNELPPYKSIMLNEENNEATPPATNSNPDNKNAAAETMRILSNNMRPDERLNLRQTEAWEMCFNAWLESEHPLDIQRRLLDHSKDEVLVWLDGKAVLLFNTQFKGEDEVEMLKELFPYPENWEDLDDALIPPPMREWIYETLGIETDDE